MGRVAMTFQAPLSTIPCACYPSNCFGECLDSPDAYDWHCDHCAATVPETVGEEIWAHCEVCAQTRCDDCRDLIGPCCADAAEWSSAAQWSALYGASKPRGSWLPGGLYYV